MKLLVLSAPNSVKSLLRSLQLLRCLEISAVCTSQRDHVHTASLHVILEL
jgi:hypothetical protein